MEPQSEMTQKRVRDEKRLRERATFMLTPALIRRLGHYVVDQRPVEKSEVIEQVLDKFLVEKGY